MDNSLLWVEINRSNLKDNVQQLKKLIGNRILCPAVKSNAYGHGLIEAGKIIEEAGADWLGVNALFEAIRLREAGIRRPIYIMGYIPLNELEIAIQAGFHFVVYNLETLKKASEISAKLQVKALTHLKLETGNQRQGVNSENLEEMIQVYKKNSSLDLIGVSTHFANIEDTTDHSYADFQLDNFQKMIGSIEAQGLTPKYKHCANSAATILFDKTYFNLVRPGIATYGMWPSSETYISALQGKREISLKPVLSWKTRIAQIKKVQSGSFIGYGCTYKATHDLILAILPVGYYDGYRRSLSNASHVLIHGKRAPVRGRVCMNMIMVDLTDIPEAQLEDEVTLLGKDGAEEITAEQMGQWMGTINYEVTTSIRENIERRIV